MREKNIQEIICQRPYLLDPEILNHGEKEKSVSFGRIDITFHTPNGIIIVECKKTPLRDKDIRQLKKYVMGLKNKGKKVIKAYLVGLKPIKPFKEHLFHGDVEIYIKELIESIPLELAYCYKGHYFSLGFNLCPYCKEEKIPGKELFLG